MPLLDWSLVKAFPPWRGLWQWGAQCNQKDMEFRTHFADTCSALCHYETLAVSWVLVNWFFAERPWRPFGSWSGSGQNKGSHWAFLQHRRDSAQLAVRCCHKSLCRMQFRCSQILHRMRRQHSTAFGPLNLLFQTDFQHRRMTRNMLDFQMPRANTCYFHVAEILKY